MPLVEQIAWIETCRVQLLKKQARERAYVDRRAARGIHTPTDEAFEADAGLENDLLEALGLLYTARDAERKAENAERKTEDAQREASNVRHSSGSRWYE